VEAYRIANASLIFSGDVLSFQACNIMFYTSFFALQAQKYY
jgi:hypothetical protein